MRPGTKVFLNTETNFLKSITTAKYKSRAFPSISNNHCSNSFKKLAF